MVSEELRQRIAAKSPKVSRYKARIEKIHQNNLFKNNQERFYDELNRATEATVSDQQCAIDFWSKIWSVSTDYKKDSVWLKKVRKEVKVEKKQGLVITVRNMKSHKLICLTN